MVIRNVESKDYEALLNMYNYYIKNTLYTLEITPHTIETISERFNRIVSKFPFIVYEEDGKILGYAYLDYLNTREGYRYTCDLSIYVDKDSFGKGIGKALYLNIEKRARDLGYRNIISIVTDENKNSIGFHEHLGFVNVGHLKNVANKFGANLGTMYFQKTL